MAVFLNPGKDQFAEICRSEYVDKTGLILELNKVLETSDKLSLVSRPRRFGKSFAAAMLCAYYGAGNNAADLFKDREVGKVQPALPHLGEYNIIYIDMTELKARAKQWQNHLDWEAERMGKEKKQADWILFLQSMLSRECAASFGEDVASFDFYQTLENVVQKEKRKFFWICDEWDLFFREPCDDVNAPDHYIEMLRALFKSSGGYASRVFAGAYLTGIMPMKVMKGESAVSDFINYTMLAPGRLAPYIGFTQSEVKELCQKHDISYQQMAEWYDGYHFKEAGAIFNPCSVMEAIIKRQFGSYWVQTSTYESLKNSIELNLDGLWDTVLTLMSGEAVVIKGRKFDNDLSHLTSANDVLLALVHLGYLAYDPETETVRIPNREIRRQFAETLSESSHAETAKLIREADGLLEATWRKDEEEVVRLISETHSLTGDAKSYNNEARLSLTVRLAYYTAKDYYVTISELPGGKGYADLVFIPKKASDKPLLIVELKWDKPVHAALDQIREKDYPQVIRNYGGRVLLVGITYRVRGERHICRITELT